MTTNATSPDHPGTLVEDQADEHLALAQRLLAARQAARLTQTEVAVATGIGRTALSDIERGLRRVGALEARDLATLYLVPVGQLLTPTVPADDGVVVELRALLPCLDDIDQAAVLRHARALASPRHLAEGPT